MLMWILRNKLGESVRSNYEITEEILNVPSAAFTLIYKLIVNTLSANKIYKWPHLYIKTQIHK